MINQILPTLVVSGNHNYIGSGKKSGDGIVTALKKLYQLNDLHPTLAARDYKSVGSDDFIDSRSSRPSVPQGEHFRRQGHNGRLNPEFCEAYMGFPVGWTDLEQDNALVCFSSTDLFGNLYPYPVIPKKQRCKNYGNRIKGAGNAIVPQVAYQIFKAIEASS